MLTGHNRYYARRRPGTIKPTVRSLFMICARRRDIRARPGRVDRLNRKTRLSCWRPFISLAHPHEFIDCVALDPMPWRNKVQDPTTDVCKHSACPEAARQNQDDFLIYPSFISPAGQSGRQLGVGLSPIHAIGRSANKTLSVVETLQRLGYPVQNPPSRTGVAHLQDCASAPPAR